MGLPRWSMALRMEMTASCCTSVSSIFMEYSCLSDGGLCYSLECSLQDISDIVNLGGLKCIVFFRYMFEIYYKSVELPRFFVKGASHIKHSILGGQEFFQVGWPPFPLWLRHCYEYC